jgi:hypothetical protein
MVKSKLVSSLLLMGTLALGLASTPAKAQVNNIVIDDVDLSGVTVDAVNRVIRATGGTVSGTIAGLPFTTDITDFELELIPAAVPGPECSVLSLELAPIDLDLLGLHVDTSEICLNVTAIRGGGLLGNLLCGLSGDILGGGNLNALLGQLTDLLENLLNSAVGDDEATPSQGGGAEDICDGECEVLDLALGPVDLTLLGLNVLLDDCDEGPVQVCVSASAGEGLLGDLLCGLAGGDLLGGLDLDLLEDLIDILDDILNLNPNAGQIQKLVNQVGGAITDGAISTKELDKLTKTVRQIARKG